METRLMSAGDIPACQAIFNASFYDLHRRHGMEEAEVDDASWLEPILRHFLQTDPAGARLAVEGEDAVAFASTFRRDDYWFLSFLFVMPDQQSRGIGRRLLSELLPDEGRLDVVRATVVESFQPVSTGLYASLGMTPRAIKYWLTDLSRPETLPRLPGDLRSTATSAGDLGDIDELDRTVLGFARPLDHRWWVEAGSPGWVYRRGDDLVAYAYVDEGYVGPALATDEETLCSVVADLVRTSPEPGGMAVNICGDAGPVFRMLVNAGARIDQEAKYRFVYCSDTGPLPPSYIHHSDWLP
jgi:GNAT superfamily N-acetyltransferase